MTKSDIQLIMERHARQERARERLALLHSIASGSWMATADERQEHLVYPPSPHAPNKSVQWFLFFGRGKP